MSLIVCIECGKEFSDKASCCPNCACPTDVIIANIRKTKEEKCYPFLSLNNKLFYDKYCELLTANEGETYTWYYCLDCGEDSHFSTLPDLINNNENEWGKEKEYYNELLHNEKEVLACPSCGSENVMHFPNMPFPQIALEENYKHIICAGGELGFYCNFELFLKSYDYLFETFMPLCLV